MNTAIVSSLALPDTIQHEVINVTPELAQQWLGLNTSNRKLKAGMIAAFTDDMVSGRWVLNGEAVKLAGPAYAPTQLLDGQNRLYAVMKSKTTVPMLVIFGVDPNAQATMDSGTKRTVADNLTISGRTHSTILASVASLAMRTESGRLTGGPLKASNAAIQEYIAAHPEMERSAEAASRFAKRSDVAPSLVGYSHWRFSQVDPMEATTFWRDAAEKVGLAAGDPVIALTNRFAEARRSRESIPVAGAVSMIFRSWNARRSGKSLRILKLISAKGGLIDIPELV